MTPITQKSIDRISAGDKIHYFGTWEQSYVVEDRIDEVIRANRIGDAGWFGIFPIKIKEWAQPELYKIEFMKSNTFNKLYEKLRN